MLWKPQIYFLFHAFLNTHKFVLKLSALWEVAARTVVPVQVQACRRHSPLRAGSCVPCDRSTLLTMLLALFSHTCRTYTDTDAALISRALSLLRCFIRSTLVGNHRRSRRSAREHYWNDTQLVSKHEAQLENGLSFW